MGSLSEAIRTSFAYERHNGVRVYNGSVAHFLIGNAPHGGYIVSLCTHATLLHQSTTLHKDPAHLTAQFFSPCQPGEVQVEIRTESASKRWTRLDVSLMQFSKVGDMTSDRIERVRLHYLFTDLPPPAAWGSEPTSASLSVLPWTKSPFARPTPLGQHPSQTKEARMYPTFRFRDVVKWSDQVPISVEDSPPPEAGPYRRIHSSFYWSQTHEEDDVTTNVALVPFFADMFLNGPELVETVHSSVRGKYWFPTLTLSLEFKAKYPLVPVPDAPSRGAKPSKSTVGIYFVTKSIAEGRHDQTVEVWTSPGEIGQGDESIGGEQWRREAQCIAISTQVALVIPFSVNEKIASKGKGKEAKL